ncbi:MAG: hypothetical protein P1U84_11975 [Parvibaculaceae bacterium]|nr:hypothetical protein [Parvibaculaceae bacterium]
MRNVVEITPRPLSMHLNPLGNELRIDEVARLLGLSESSVRRLTVREHDPLPTAHARGSCKLWVELEVIQWRYRELSREIGVPRLLSMLVSSGMQEADASILLKRAGVPVIGIDVDDASQTNAI